MTQPNHSVPICPVHGTVMLPHKFEPCDIKVVRDNVNGFKCADLRCSVVYIDEVGRFFVIEDSMLTPFTKAFLQ